MVGCTADCGEAKGSPDSAADEKAELAEKTNANSKDTNRMVVWVNLTLFTDASRCARAQYLHRLGCLWTGLRRYAIELDRHSQSMM
jgi:hypothetical protein